MPGFKLLHASDFHLARVPSSAPPPPDRSLWPRLKRRSQKEINKLYQTLLTAHDDAVLEAFARWVFENSAGLDAVVLTGDLANTGFRRDLKRALRFVDGPAVTDYYDANGDPTLGFLPQGRCLLLPGNHDRYKAIPGYPPGGKKFDRVFAAHWPGGFLGVSAWYLPDNRRDLVVIAADFALAGNDWGQFHFFNPGWLGQGRQTAATLKKLRNATTRLRARYRKNGADPAVIWAVHFDVHSTDGGLALLDSTPLVEAAQEDGVRIVLAGHTHESKVKPLTQPGGVGWEEAGQPVVTELVCGTTAQAKSPQGNDFQILDLDVPDDGTAMTVTVTWYRYAGLSGFERLPGGCEVRV